MEDVQGGVRQCWTKFRRTFVESCRLFFADPLGAGLMVFLYSIVMWCGIVLVRAALGVVYSAFEW